ncbi:MAG: hypothetical protein CVV22_06780 [Ignavibacteriae bacterium HGW-Ignavibacteriae-1]|jgi:hypothetical protein|nr:MAG: hypothetical protein CVV22_06780 [Ignavibacteriae bacterium HGW-Ignavibacteriae-1]
MNKKYVLVILGVLVAVTILIFSIYWSPVDESDASGAFTKADRYRESTIGDENIVLRSDLLNDTNMVKKTIYDLVEFGDFALYLKGMINEWWIPVLETYNQSPTISSSVAELRDYSDFITNNTTTIQNTIVTLAGFYSGETKEMNKDVESQLKQFYNFANQFLLRDSIFEATIANIDYSIQNDNLRKKELDGLKALRDRIVVDNFIYAVSTGDSSKMYYSASQVLNDPNYIKGMNSQEIINAINTGYTSFVSISNSGLSLNTVNAINNIISSFSVSSAQSATNQYIGNYAFMFSFNSEFCGAFNQEVVGIGIPQSAANSQQNAVGTTLGMAINNQGIGAASNQLIGEAAMNQGIGTAAANQFSIGVYNASQIGIVYMSAQGIISF